MHIRVIVILSAYSYSLFNINNQLMKKYFPSNQTIHALQNKLVIDTSKSPKKPTERKQNPKSIYYAIHTNDQSPPKNTFKFKKENSYIAKSYNSIKLPSLSTSTQKRQKTEKDESQEKSNSPHDNKSYLVFQKGQYVIKTERKQKSVSQFESKSSRSRTKSNLQELLKVDNKIVQKSQIKPVFDIKSFPYAWRSLIGKKANMKNKKQNQDSVIISTENKDYSLFGVCDGHGTYGHLVSQYVSQNLPQLIDQELEKNEYVLSCDKKFHHTLLRKVFYQTNNQLKDQNINTYQSGSTANVVLIIKQQKSTLGVINEKTNEMETVLYCSHVGDSRAIVVKNTGKNKKILQGQIICLSKDHKTDDPIEKERIIQHGGVVDSYRDVKGLALGPQRIWVPDMSGPGLAMSRSFGDRQAAQLGLIVEPSTSQYVLTHEDCFLIVGSDGIWQYLTNEEIVNTVWPFYIENKVEESAQRLVERATKAWKENDNVIDDISCVIVFINGVSS